MRWSSREESICGVGGSRPRRYCPPARYAQGVGCLPTPGNPPKGMSRPLVAAPSGSIQVFRRPSTINATPHWCSPIVYGWWRATERREVGAPWRSG